MDWTEIHQKTRNTNCELLDRSCRVVFRDLFDPYCSEYKDIDDKERLQILNSLAEADIALITLYTAFVTHYHKLGRPDIAISAGDGMVRMVEYLRIISWKGPLPTVAGKSS